MKSADPQKPSPAAAETAEATRKKRPAAASNPPTPSVRQRVNDYRSWVLRRKDPLTAAMGGINGELMELATQLNAVFCSELTKDGDSIDTVLMLLPALQTQLQLHRQIGRHADFIARREASQAKRAAARDTASQESRSCKPR